MRAVLGLDVGTTSVKAVVLSQDGQVLAQGTSDSLPMRAPRPGWAVQPTAALHDAVVQCLRAVAGSLSGSLVSSLAETEQDEAEHDQVELAALASAVQSGSLVLIDQAGEVAADLTTWMDTRCSSLVQGWQNDGTSDTIRSICGWSVHPGQGLPQLAWLRANSPESLEGQAASADDLVANWLTGEWVTNPSNAAGMAMMDMATGKWDSNLCDLAGLQSDQLSELRPSGTVIGELSPIMAEATDLETGLAVISGGHDQACTALALGVTEPAQALLAGGTAWVLTSVITPEAAADIPVEMNISTHVVPGSLTASKYLGGMGVCIEWWLETCDPEASSDGRFATLIRDLVGLETTVDSPFFHLVESAGGTTDTSPGAGVFIEGSLEAADVDRARSIMEYAAFQVRTTLLALPLAHRPTAMSIVGGATRLPGWSQMIADVCDLPVIEATTQDLPALGAAILAGAASGLFPDVQTGAATLSIDQIQFSPNARMTELFAHRYQQHLQQESQS